MASVLWKISNLLPRGLCNNFRNDNLIYLQFADLNTCSKGSVSFLRKSGSKDFTSFHQCSRKIKTNSVLAVKFTQVQINQYYFMSSYTIYGHLKIAKYTGNSNLKCRSQFIFRCIAKQTLPEYCFGTACNSFSKDNYQQKNIENSDKTSDTDIDSVKDESLLEKDFDFKSIIEDIKQDFANERSKDKVSESSQKDQEQSHKHPHPKQDNSVKSQAAEQFEYDYSVAEDIEEYEFIDESDIGKHEVQAEKNLPINLERGKSGVFDLDELLILLESLGAQDIVSFPVPPEANFCDHMVVVSAKSRRHLQAINEEMLWVHKRKKSGSDSHLLIEGINKSDWCAMDLGNIVLHVFYGNLRHFYDIESLWMLGPENDPKCRGEEQQDPYTLSAEDLFWLETAKSKDGSATTVSDQTVIGNSKNTDSSPDCENVLSDFPYQQEKSAPKDQISDLEAGWGNRPSFSKN